VDHNQALNKTLHVVAGATATGKTAYALALARKLGGVLINADSRQIYRDLDIGTNKGKLSEGEIIKYGEHSWREFFIDDKHEVAIWLVDLVAPDEGFSIVAYRDLANAAIAYAFGVGKTPILVGGSGMYIDAVINPAKYDKVIGDEDIQARSELSRKSLEELQTLVGKETLQQMNTSDRQNPRRLVNKLLRTEAPAATTSAVNIPFTAVVRHYCELPAEELRARIFARVETMWQQGLVDEARRALAKYSSAAPGLTGSGYPAMIKFINGEISESEAKMRVAIAHWQVARKQLTWFKKYYIPYIT
jgi:tRNA dimethylallyltransferase